MERLTDFDKLCDYYKPNIKNNKVDSAENQKKQKWSMQYVHYGAVYSVRNVNMAYYLLYFRKIDKIINQLKLIFSKIVLK